MKIVKVKVKDIRTGAIKEVKKSLASDYVGTGNFELVTETREPRKSSFYKNEK